MNPAAPAVLGDLAEDIAAQLAQLDLAGQLGVALKLVLLIVRRLPVDLQAETSAEALLALAQELPR